MRQTVGHGMRAPSSLHYARHFLQTIFCHCLALGRFGYLFLRKGHLSMTLTMRKAPMSRNLQAVVSSMAPTFFV